MNQFLDFFALASFQDENLMHSSGPFQGFHYAVDSGKLFRQSLNLTIYIYFLVIL